MVRLAGRCGGNWDARVSLWTLQLALPWRSQTVPLAVVRDHSVQC